MIVIPFSARAAFALSLGSKITNKLKLNKYNKYKKQSGKDQQTTTFLIKSLEIVYKTIYMIEDNESLCNVSNNTLMRIEMKFFYKTT